MTPSKRLTSIFRLQNQTLKPRVHTFTAQTTTRPAFHRTMASNASNPPAGEVPTPNTDSQSQGTPLPLPEPSSDATQLNVNGDGVKLDHLGPLVVNKDGSLSRISNWDNMAEIEKQNTLRILGKRNQLRLGDLKAEGKEVGK